MAIVVNDLMPIVKSYKNKPQVSYLPSDGEVLSDRD